MPRIDGFMFASQRLYLHDFNVRTVSALVCDLYRLRDGRCECPGNLIFWKKKKNRERDSETRAWRRVKHLITSSWRWGRTVDYVKGIVNLPLLFYTPKKNVRRYFPLHDFICFHRKLKLLFPNGNKMTWMRYHHLKHGQNTVSFTIYTENAMRTLLVGFLRNTNVSLILDHFWTKSHNLIFEFREMIIIFQWIVWLKKSTGISAVIDIWIYSDVANKILVVTLWKKNSCK